LPQIHREIQSIICEFVAILFIELGSFNLTHSICGNTKDSTHKNINHMKKALFTFTILVSVFTFVNFSNASANNAPAGTEIPKNVQQV